MIVTLFDLLIKRNTKLEESMFLKFSIFRLPLISGSVFKLKSPAKYMCLILSGELTVYH